MYSIIDIESNGAGFRKESIIEIAIYKFDGHHIVDQFSSLVNPEDQITPFVQKLTGISPKMVKTAPKFHEIAKRIIELTENTTLVGHNIEFDYRMLRQSFQRLGYSYKIQTLDTIPLAKKLIPEAESYSLSKLVKSLGIPLTEPHRARGDARATLELFKLLMTKDSENDIIQTQHEETNSKTYINKIRELTQDLPSDSGIVYFQNKKGEILHTDFADNINRFSKKIFNSKSKKNSVLQESTELINYEISCNKIVAYLLMASKGIKKKENLTYGLYHNSDTYEIKKIISNNPNRPLLKLYSHTQARKVLNYVKNKDSFKDVNSLKKLLSLKGRNEIWSIQGRTLGEKAFLVLEKGKFSFFGFYELYSQISTLSKIEKRKIEIKKLSPNFNNELKLQLLKGDIDILSIPSK